MEYLVWYRQVLDLPVINKAKVGKQGSGSFRRDL
jgi:hypothetical protein